MNRRKAKNSTMPRTECRVVSNQLLLFLAKYCTMLLGRAGLRENCTLEEFVFCPPSPHPSTYTSVTLLQAKAEADGKGYRTGVGSTSPALLGPASSEQWPQGDQLPSRGQTALPLPHIAPQHEPDVGLGLGLPGQGVG